MGTIQEIQDVINILSDCVTKFATQLTEIAADLDALKAARQDTPLDVLKQIERQAQANPICNRALQGASETARQTYMRLLAMLAIGNEGRLLFARRIGVGSGSRWDADRLAGEGMNVNARLMEDAAKHLRDLRHPLLLDSLVMANLSGAAKDKDWQLIAGVAEILKCEESAIAMIALLAAALLQKDRKSFNNIVTREKKILPEFSHLFPPEWLTCELYRKVARHGDAETQYNLGLMYECGQGVEQDYAQAVEWYYKAAEQGYADAQYKLGWMYENARAAGLSSGISPLFIHRQHKYRKAQAAEWYRKAAQQGHSEAKRWVKNNR